MPASGQLTLRVTGESSSIFGRYRLYVQSVDPRPELASATLLVNDSVLTESIGRFSDVDDFVVDVPATITANIVIETAAGAAPGLFAELFAGSNRLAVAARHGVDTVVQSTRFTLPAGRHRLRVSGAVQEGGFLGAYRLYLYRIESLPEGRSPVAHIGDDVTERLDPLGDIDLYDLVGNRGEHFRLLFSGSPPPGGSFSLTMGDPSLETYAPVTLTVDDLSHGVMSPRIMLTKNGAHSLSVIDGDGGHARRAGSYQVRVLPYDPTPEHHDRIIQVGDTIVNELIDVLYDADEFIVRGAPGSEVVVFLRDRTLPTQTVMLLDVVDPVTKEIRPSDITPFLGGPEGISGRYATLSSAGELMLRLQTRSSSAALPYGLAVLGVNRAPETAPAHIVLGDTVAGESIDTRADVDEVRFTAPAGSLQLGVLLPNGALTSYGVNFTVVNAQTGAHVTGFRPQYVGPRSDYIIVNATVPAGEYIVRASANYEWAGPEPYRFFVRRPP
jgi:hypothetical protein